MAISTIGLAVLDTPDAGFAVVDEKCRVSIPREVRQALEIGPGARLAYATIDGMFVLIPQDKHLAILIQGATKALANAGLTAQDIIDELPAIRDEMMRETYGEAFVAELARVHAALRSAEGETDSSATRDADE
jgi:bifunctional DNA-binding transcriptional regulator/antitoxin component of YhaV-PrlF toxin-antitoxin module